MWIYSMPEPVGLGMPCQEDVPAVTAQALSLGSHFNSFQPWFPAQGLFPQRYQADREAFTVCSQNTEPGLARGCSYPTDLVLGMAQPWARLLLLWELSSDPLLFPRCLNSACFPLFSISKRFFCCFLLISSISRFWVKTSPFPLQHPSAPRG